MFPKDVSSFFDGVRRLAARARERGDLDDRGDPIWSCAEWRAFCKGARSYSHLPFFGNAIVNTVLEVEAMLEDGFDARSIHAVLRGFGVEAERRRIAAANSALPPIREFVA